MRRLRRRVEAEPIDVIVGPVDTQLELDEALLALDDDRRAAFVLTQVSGLRYDEAAELLDVPIGTIRSRGCSRPRAADRGAHRPHGDPDPGTEAGQRATHEVMVIVRSFAPLVPVFVAVILGLAACGSDGAAPALDLTAAGAAGQALANDKGCGSCHGRNGEGTDVAPAFQGLLGRTVTLRDDEVVVADEAYIVESIREPAAKRVEGYGVPMPQVSLSDDEVASIIDYITELTGSPSATTAP